MIRFAFVAALCAFSASAFAQDRDYRDYGDTARERCENRGPDWVWTGSRCLPSPPDGGQGSSGCTQGSHRECDYRGECWCVGDR